MGHPGYPPCGIHTHDTPEWAPQDYIAERYHLGDLVVPGLCKRCTGMGPPDGPIWASILDGVLPDPPRWHSGPFGLSLRAPVAHCIGPMAANAVGIHTSKVMHSVGCIPSWGAGIPLVEGMHGREGSHLLCCLNKEGEMEDVDIGVQMEG